MIKPPLGVIGIIGIIAVAPFRVGAQNEQDNAARGPILRKIESIKNKLNHIIIPKLDFKETPVREAIDLLRKKSVEFDTTERDPARKGINIIMEIEPFRGQILPLSDRDAASLADTKITVSLANVPLSEALRAVTNAAGLLRYKVEPYAVVIVPVLMDDFATKEYKVPPEILTGKDGRVQTARELLESSGVTFPPGTSAEYLTSIGALVVRNSDENLDLVDQIVDAAEPKAPNTETIHNKLDHLIIQKIDFKNATLRDAIEFLHEKSVELDTTETDLIRKGVSIVVRGSGPNLGDPVADITVPAKIDLTLANIPLSEALRYVATLTGLTLKVYPSEVMLTPLHVTAYIRQKLDRIVIPKVDFRETPLRDAIDYLHRESVELDTGETDPARKGVNIVLKLDEAPEESGPHSAPNAGAIAPKDAKITLSLTNIPLSAALDYVTKLAGLKVKIEPFAVIILPLSSPGPLVTKEYTVPPESFQSRDVMHAQTAREFLENAGVGFPSGADANYDPANNRLVVRTTEQDIGKVDELLKEATPLSEEELEQAATAIQKNEYIENKLDHIIIPEINFRGTTLRAAAELLQKESIAFNTAESRNKGFRIVMKLGPRPVDIGSLEKPGDPADEKITLVVKNIPLSEAFRYVTELSGVKYRVSPDALNIVPISEPTDLPLVREFYVPPDFLQSTGTGVRTAQELLERAGLQFPEGTDETAKYLPAFDKLVVCGTYDEFDLIGQIVDAMMPRSAAELQEADRIAAVKARNAKMLRDKLDRIIIPKIAFHEATLSDVMLDLMNILPALDTKEAKPARRGINLVWNPKTDARISLSLASVSLGELLRQIAGQAGSKVRVDPYAIVMARPLDYRRNWVIKTYKVPPGFPGNAIAIKESAPTTPSEDTVLNFLKDGGVQFPQGSSACFFPATGKIFVSNTETNMDLVDRIVEDYINARPAITKESQSTPSTSPLKAKAAN